MNPNRVVVTVVAIIAILAIPTVLCCGAGVIFMGWRPAGRHSIEQATQPSVDDADTVDGYLPETLPEQALDPGDVDVITMCEEFEENWPKAFAKYRKKPTSLIGFVVAISKDSDGQYAQLLTRSGPRFKFVGRDAEHREELTRLTKGDIVRLKCQINTRDTSTVYGEKWEVEILGHL